MTRAAHLIVVATILTACSLDRGGVAADPLDGDIRDAPFDALAPGDASDTGTPPSDSGMRGPLVIGDGTFSRSSAATFVSAEGSVVTVPVDAPRETTLQGQRVRLIEGSTTNLIRHSDSQTTGWTNSGFSISENATTAPDGSLTADRVATPFNYFGPTQPVTAPEGPLALSVWARSAPGPAIAFRARFSYDMSRFGQGISAKGAVTSEWARLRGSGRPHDPPMEYVAIDGRQDIPSVADPAIAQDVWVWGWQLEAAEFSTSYVPTADATATRAEDRWVFDLGELSSDFSRASAMVLVSPEWSSAERTSDAWLFSVGTAGIRVVAGINLEVVVDAAVQVSIVLPAFSPGDVIEVQYEPELGRLTAHAGSGATSTATGTPWTWPTAPLNIGTSPSAGTQVFGWISAPYR